MKKIIVFILLLSISVFAQQIRHTWGQKITSGNPWNGAVYTALFDTVTANRIRLVVDINDFYFGGTQFKLIDTLYVGTLYQYYDAQNAADSTMALIKACPGLYSDETKSIANIKLGTAITCETVRVVGDKMAITPIYISTDQKLFPPEVIEISLKGVTDSDFDDSCDVYLDFAYPQLLQQYRERKEDSENTNRD